jgi:hypothetical protein
MIDGIEMGLMTAGIGAGFFFFSVGLAYLLKIKK